MQAKYQITVICPICRKPNISLNLDSAPVYKQRKGLWFFVDGKTQQVTAMSDDKPVLLFCCPIKLAEELVADNPVTKTKTPFAPTIPEDLRRLASSCSR